MTPAIALLTIIHVLGFGPDCAPSEIRSLNRELLHLRDHHAQAVQRRGPLSDEAIEIKDDMREKQDEIIEWREACERIASPRPMK